MPTCVTESQGLAQIQILQDGTIESLVILNNKGAGLDELLANPGDFYVNFHSDVCPSGFGRGFLP